MNNTAMLELQKVLGLSEAELHYAELISHFCNFINHADYKETIKDETMALVAETVKEIRETAAKIELTRAIQIIHTIACWPSEPGKHNIMLAYLLR